MSVFKIQSLLSITLETNYNALASASVTRILYKKPNGTTGYWTATVSGTKLIYNVQNGDIDINGTWKFQSYIEAGGLKGFGSVATQNFDIPLQ